MMSLCVDANSLINNAVCGVKINDNNMRDKKTPFLIEGFFLHKCREIHQNVGLLPQKKFTESRNFTKKLSIILKGPGTEYFFWVTL